MLCAVRSPLPPYRPPVSTPPAPTVHGGRVSAPLSLLAGFLMGLANLVPGLSGGTMILVLGLYERFIGAVAEVTRLKPSKHTLVFLGLFGLGLGAGVIGLAKLAVWAVTEQRMLAFALFLGLTFGVVPDLLKEVGRLSIGIVVAVLVGAALVVAPALSGEASVDPSPVSLALVGALAAGSMILPGVSGSYILLLFGLYATVIGAIPLLGSEPAEALSVLVPVGVGVVLGIALLANLLRYFLAKHSEPTHGVLLGLVLGSVVGLWPFQELTDPELGVRDTRKAIEVVVLDGGGVAEVLAERGLEVTEEDVQRWRATYGSLDKNALKRRSNAATRFAPNATQLALSAALAVVGFILTRLLARIGARP
jgi:putative membrane protein